MYGLHGLYGEDGTVPLYVSMYACMHACVHGCVYVCTYVYYVCRCVWHADQEGYHKFLLPTSTAQVRGDESVRDLGKRS